MAGGCALIKPLIEDPGQIDMRGPNPGNRVGGIPPLDGSAAFDLTTRRPLLTSIQAF